MKTINNSTKNNMSELSFIFCGKTEEFKVQENCETPILKIS